MRDSRSVDGGKQLAEKCRKALCGCSFNLPKEDFYTFEIK